MVKQTIMVLNSKGAKLTEQNIKQVIGPRWACKMANLFPMVWFVVDEWQDKALQNEIEFHNLRARAAWLSVGGDAEREYWFHVVELSLDHLRPSREWMRDGEKLLLEKMGEAISTRRSARAAKERRKEKEKMETLRQVAEEIARNWKWK